MVLWLLVGVVAAAFVGGTAALGPAGDVHLGTCIITGFVAPIVVGIALVARFDQWLDDRRDLRDGRAEQLSGRFRLAVGADEAFGKLVEAGLLPPPDDASEETHDVAICERTRRLLSIDGRFVPIVVRPDVLETAVDTRPFRPTRAEGEPGVIALTEDERAEIGEHAERLWRTPGELVGVLVWLGIGVLGYRATGEWRWTHTIRFGLWGLVALVFLVRFIGRILGARALQRDAQQGEAVEVELEGHRVVLLLHSEQPWSVDGQPAEWRSRKL